MRVFLTGGSGFIGGRLTEKLVSENINVTLLMRNVTVESESFNENLSVLRGDLSDVKVLKKGMEGCEIVFHLAAFARPWSHDPLEPERVNVSGTQNVLEAALSCGVKRVVLTSTAGLTGYSHDGIPVDEQSVNPAGLYTPYERSKALGEKIALIYANKGLNVVIVSPTRVYGPGKLTKSNSVTRIIDLYRKGLWRIIPGDGTATGNYVFIDDVVTGLLLAARKGVMGEKYLLGGEDLTFNELFRILGSVSGHQRLLVPFPVPLMRSVVSFAELTNRLTGIPPFMTREWLNKYLCNWLVSSSKAERDLGYSITPFKTGAAQTIEWLRQLR